MSFPMKGLMTIPKDWSLTQVLTMAPSPPQPPAPSFSASGGIDRNPSIDFEPTWVKGFEDFLKALETNASSGRQESHKISNGGPE